VNSYTDRTVASPKIIEPIQSDKEIYIRSLGKNPNDSWHTSVIGFCVSTILFRKQKRKYESVGNQKENIKDTDDAMYVDDVEFSNNDNSDNDYEADNDLDCYLSDEDVQPQFRKMEPFQDSSVPHKET